MRRAFLLFLFMPIFSVCGEESGRLVTLTTYWSSGAGSDRWSAENQSASGQELRENSSVAADPSIYPYGTIIDIKGVGQRVALDTGSDVIKRKASRLRGVNYPVIDLFFESKSEALRFSQSYPTFTTVRIVKLGHNISCRSFENVKSQRFVQYGFEDIPYVKTGGFTFKHSRLILRFPDWCCYGVTQAYVAWNSAAWCPTLVVPTRGLL